ncbi:glycosyltransferase family 4 protein [Rathayibacter tanaceti]|uniref:D-inositol 3-phosphate glycosyltransferase n=2 Tax=Rathayibacter tanaceti TaxID=1671680 RepID=A0A166H1J0_9MICO|nr:glycosyltransferase family 4 protein [Rathayibacter tanaceti]KZX19764.1 Glycogen synthase [Rathayibacter tanaceti]QHC54836.1 glycosyltransferase [Rathayibacter tanaceti]TCO38369.1 glycosyltransferase involved in cell wall biosynthesis [Rathayibacter tanaceti]
MRLLFLSNLYPPQVLGGYEMTCARVAEAMAARGHTVRVLTTPTYLPPEPTASPDVEVHRTLSLRTYFPLPQTGTEVARLMHHESAVSRFENTRILLEELRDFAPTHVVAFNLLGIGGLALIDLLRSVDAPWLWNLGDRTPNALVDGLPERVLAVYGAQTPDHFDRGEIVAVSRSLVETIEAGGLSLGEVEVIGRGVTVPPDSDEPRRYREGGVTRFTFAASLGEHKGVGLVLEAAAVLAAETRAFRVDLYGDGDVDGWRARAAEAGLDGLVEFHGATPRDEVLSAHERADAFLFPTWAGEPFGVAPVEAAAAGCVPIVTAASGVAEFLIDGVDCVKITRSAPALLAAMRDVVSGATDLEALGRRGRAAARGPLSFERSVELIEASLERRGRPGSLAERLADTTVEADIMDKDERAMDVLHRSLSGRDHDDEH